MKHGKKYVDGAKLIERSRLYDTQEALDLCVKTGTAKFDETVEVHVKLGVDGRHADQQVRGAIVLPHGTGKTVRVLAICKPEKEDEARAAGAEFVGGNDMILHQDFPDGHLVLCQGTGFIRTNDGNRTQSLDCL